MAALMLPGREPEIVGESLRRSGIRRHSILLGCLGHLGLSFNGKRGEELPTIKAKGGERRS